MRVRERSLRGPRARLSRRAALPLTSALLASLALSGGAAARPADNVTLVYDVKLREFVCWYERAPEASACSGRDTHAYQERVHFYRGQTITLQLGNAHVADLFALQLTVNDLAEPMEPIYGALTEVPRVKMFEPTEMVVSGPGVEIPRVTARPSLPGKLYRGLDQWEPKEAPAKLKALVRDPSNLDTVLKSQAWESRVLIQQLDERLDESGPLVGEAKGIKAQLDEQLDGSVSSRNLARLRSLYCDGSVAPDSNGAANLAAYMEDVERIRRPLERMAALSESIAALDVGTLARSAGEQIKLLSEPEVQELLGYDDGDPAALDAFIGSFESEFPRNERPQVFQHVDFADDPPRYVKRDSSSKFLESLSREAHPSPAGRDRLRQNLALMDEDLLSSLSRIARFKRYASCLLGYQYRGTPSGSSIRTDEACMPKAPMAWSAFQFQRALDEISLAAVRVADAANCVAARMPLPAPRDQIAVGRWYGNEEILLTLKQGNRLPAFKLGAVRKGVVKLGEEPIQDSSRTDLAPLSTVRETSFQIHQLYRFQLGAGFLVSNLRDEDFELITKTVMENGTQQREQFFVRTRDRHYHFLPTVELIVFPVRREFFPWKARYPNEPKPSPWQALGLVAGFSLSNPGQDFLAGVAWTPRPAFGLKAGIHLGYEDALPKGVKVKQPIEKDASFASQDLRHGYFVGLTFTTQFFKDVFGTLLRR